MTPSGGAISIPEVDGHNFLANAPEQMWRWMYYCESQGWCRFPMEVPVNEFTTDFAALRKEAKEIVAAAVAYGWAKYPPVRVAEPVVIINGVRKRAGTRNVCGVDGFERHRYGELGYCMRCNAPISRSAKNIKKARL